MSLAIKFFRITEGSNDGRVTVGERGVPHRIVVTLTRIHSTGVPCFNASRPGAQSSYMTTGSAFKQTPRNACRFFPLWVLNWRRAYARTCLGSRFLIHHLCWVGSFCSARSPSSELSVQERCRPDRNQGWAWAWPRLGSRGSSPHIWMEPRPQSWLAW